MYKRFAEWNLINEDYTDNPPDVFAHAVFTHKDGEIVRSFMFYDGNNSWKFRFIGTKTGKLTIEIKGPGKLSGKRGQYMLKTIWKTFRDL